MKRITDDEIITTLVAFGLLGGIIAHNYVPEGAAIAQAQLEADQKAHEAVVRELQDEMQTLRELMGGQKAAHKAVVREIIETIKSMGHKIYFKTSRLQNTYTQSPTNTTSHFIDAEAIDIIVQALKQRYGGE